jgi:hypothetical protein
VGLRVQIYDQEHKLLEIGFEDPADVSEISIIPARLPATSDFEKWTVEYGDKPDTVALKCVANDKYLTAEPKHYGKAFVRDEKEWWNVVYYKERVRVPGAYLLSLVSNPKVFLFASQAGAVLPGRPGAKAFMHEWMVSYFHHVHESKPCADSFAVYGTGIQNDVVLY